MMRVALVSPLFESVPPRTYGGTERVVYNLCKGLAAAGIEVTLFASADSAAGCELVPVVGEALRLSGRPIGDPLAHNLRMLAMVAERAGDFDLIHNHHDYWMLPLTRMTSVPVLTTLHGRLDIVGAMEAYRSFPDGAFVSISDSQREPMPELNWVRTVHHGLGLDEFPFHPKPGNYLAFLGRISPEKGPEAAIEIARRSGVPLKIAAKIEGQRNVEYWESVIKRRIDGRFIEYIGEIGEREKADFLGGALATAFPIDWPEPFGLVMIESLACGTPVLGRPCGAAREILADGITGFADPDVGELARRVRDIPSIDRRRCRQWVEERFSLRRMTEDYIHVYRQLVEFAPARARAGEQPRRPDRRRRHLLYPFQRAADGNT